MAGNNYSDDSALEEILADFERTVSENFNQAADMYFRCDMVPLDLIKSSGNSEAVSTVESDYSGFCASLHGKEYTTDSKIRQKRSYSADMYNVLMLFRVLIYGDKKINHQRIMSLIDVTAPTEDGADRLMKGWQNTLEKLYKNNALKPFDLDDALSQNIISAYYELIRKGSTVSNSVQKKSEMNHSGYA